MASTYLTRTCGIASNRKIFTFSFWMKISEIASNYNEIFNSWYSSDNRFIFYLSGSNGQFNIYNNSGGSNNVWLQTNRVFRDFNAWYHIYVAVDTTQSTASDRIKLYVNGVQETSLSQNTYPSQNTDMMINPGNTYSAIIGRNGTNNQYYFNGILSHFYYVDGSVIDITQFGSNDATTGEWKINTNPTIASYGNEGFLILKDGNTITDQSPNSNDFALGGGTLTKTEDCPSNVFATLNPLGYWRGQSHASSGALSKGNNTTGIGSSEKTLLHSTIGVSSGKWYWEAKSDGVSKMFFGICNKNAFGDTSAPHDSAGYNGIYYYEAIPDFRANTGDGAKTTGISSITTGDVLGFALDMDNWALYIHKNGTYMNSGNPTSGSSKTGAISELFNYGTWYMRYNEEVFASCYVSSTSGSGTASYNFGNGYFGTQQVSSAGTNASGIGIFEYDVPTGYTALSTKGLNQ